ncbi:MAG: helix-turn-helix domain-containing protein [Firmicutes bacterium]|nr:helix-turn-helix domain-containing protein [Bacillota bacterium]
MNKTLFGERLKYLRQERNIGQNELAKKLDVGNATISRWENGLQEPDFYYAIKVSTFFEVSLDYLAGLTEY